MNKAIIHAHNNYLASSEIQHLKEVFEGNFNLIINKLNIADNFPEINYYLFPSEAIKIEETGEDGYAETDRKNFKVFMVYNKDIQPIGPHELVHLLTNQLGYPNYVFNEGFAEYFEGHWSIETDGVLIQKDHDDWVRQFIKDNKYITINQLFDDNKFWECDKNGTTSYPESGSFVRYIITKYGMPRFLDAFSKLSRRPENPESNFSVFQDVFGKSVNEAEQDWLTEINLKH